MFVEEADQGSRDDHRTNACFYFFAGCQVTYFNALASFVDPYTVRATYADGSTKNVTARNFVVAVGGRPSPLPNCEGAHHAIDSDDIFSLTRNPGKTLCIGASYVSSFWCDHPPSSCRSVVATVNVQ